MKQRRSMKATVAVTLACGLLLGCATPEYKQAQSECAPEAFRLYPIHRVPTLVNHTRAVQVPTGQSHCVTTQTGNVSNTTCQQVMRTDFVPYLESVMVDVNARDRESLMSQCAAQLCSTRYGNTECKTK
jgi:hypothetical protein